MTISEAAQALRDACATVDGIRVSPGMTGTVDPPACIVGPPLLDWRTLNGPDIATFTVLVVVKLNDRALDELWSLVPLVADALDAVPGAVVKDASPTVWQADSPAYQITCEVAL